MPKNSLGTSTCRSATPAEGVRGPSGQQVNTAGPAFAMYLDVESAAEAFAMVTD
ncbi:hypothetical protein [Nocardia sp. NPDC006630]|uniref:hypothetical protein n=1 Tax=Nocardia sp. NPDC006630 TaxID=3157181 RepID=UPI0033A64CAC